LENLQHLVAAATPCRLGQQLVVSGP